MERELGFKSNSKILEKLREIGHSKKFVQDEVILQECSYIKAIPIVTNGSIKVLRSDEEGREILLYYITPGESCIMSFLGGMHGDKSQVSAIAEEDTEVLFVPLDKISELIKEYPEWLDYIFKLYHKRFEELLNVVNEVAFKKMDERLLHFIQNKCKVMETNVLVITHEQLANELGTARVVVSRLLKEMETTGLVELHRNKIILL